MGNQQMSRGQMTYFMNYLELFWCPTVIWYIPAGDQDILVDTGTTPEIQQKAFPFPYEELASFENLLQSVGKKPEDIDIVIQTHLHFDHCAHLNKCINAKVYVQEDEVKFAYNPHPVFLGSYNKKVLKDMRLVLVNGEKEIVPGVTVIPVPGHSPGAQAVAVQTEKGLAVICGFCTVKENFYPPEKLRTSWPVITPGVHTDALQAFDSAMRIKGLADIIIPFHEMAFAQKETIP
jgi:glyoxylase-like metal-dependent hydrolase (beta-lactamase superfamily II)